MKMEKNNKSKNLKLWLVAYSVLVALIIFDLLMEYTPILLILFGVFGALWIKAFKDYIKEEKKA